MSFSVVVALAGALTVGAALLPARGSDPASPPRAATTSNVSYIPSADLESEVASLRSRVGEIPQDARAWATLSLLLIEQARETVDPAYYLEAEAAAQESLQRQPQSNDLGLAAKAALLSAQHRFAAALNTANAALEVDPYSVPALGVRVDALTELGQLPQALRAARAFDAKQPGLAATTRLAYQAELRANDQVAVRYFREARDEATDATSRAFVEYHLGELARRDGRLELADDHYRRALQALPADPSATAGRARVLTLRGDTERAVGVLTELVQRTPLPEHLIQLGELHLLAGDRKAAVAQFDVVRASARLARANGVRPDLELAWFEADHGDPQTALRLARAEWEKRQPPMVADALAWALHANGRDAEALRYARLATAVGGDARSWHHRGDIELSLGMDTAARAHLQQALDMDSGYSPWAAAQVRESLAVLGTQR
jgi:tetratricopeptide (TPR) repeat protein